MWELLVLSNLKWDISSVTAQDFINHILRRIPVDQTSCNCTMLIRHTQTFIALCARGKFEIKIKKSKGKKELTRGGE